MGFSVFLGSEALVRFLLLGVGLDHETQSLLERELIFRERKHLPCVLLAVPAPMSLFSSVLGCGSLLLSIATAMSEILL